MTRRLTTLALALWLAGFGCFLGCELNVSAAPAVESEVSSAAESCQAFSGEDCCHKTDASGGASFKATPAEQGVSSCCPLTGQAADPARKVGGLNAPPEVAQSWTPPAQHVAQALTLPATNPQLPDRGSTHLRCCVFLI
ncbi:MAG: hypothetical protein ACJ74W_14970 [Pyrinomonadaceae bacterium]